MDLGSDGIRPVELELIEFFNQHINLQATVIEVNEMLGKLGHKHVYASVRDNLELLAMLGFLICDESQHKFSLNQNPTQLGLTKAIPHGLRLTKHNKLANGRCDKCHRKLKLGEKSFIKQYGNLQICLCMDCFERKPMLCQV